MVEERMSNAHLDLRMVDVADNTSDGEAQRLRAVVQPASRIDVAPTIQALTPYEAVSSQAAIEAQPDHRTVFKLDWNESTIEPSPRVTAAIAQYLTHGRGLNWYPRLGSVELLDALSGYTGVSTDSLLVTNGSDDALHLICSTYLDRGDDVVIPVPTYNHFMVFAQSRGANVITVRGETAFDTNLEGIRAQMTRRTRLLYLVSPNNPTGMVFDPEVVAAFCRDFPETLVVLDEAYFEFSQVTGVELVRQFDNLIVTRTFSKAFGLAGLRVGYLAASPELVDGLRRIYNPKSVNSLGQIGAIAALGDLDYLNRFLAQVRESKEMLGRFFEERGVEAYITSANFVVVRVDDIVKTLDELESRGVYVRDRSSYPGLEGCLRMSVGTVEQTGRLLERISDVF
ncbi:histidinol-phosphate transaminase [Lujinxingia litoralis]|uniref:Histidinol-phosphate aminotransferase n=2 Tax=Lujinxingia litoralis TaxID=2211119 RepID=A0A328C4L4_9DELT|nr:histidinol-phosphate transaminase [Lujinxingia litoralis]